MAHHDPASEPGGRLANEPVSEPAHGGGRLTAQHWPAISVVDIEGNGRNPPEIVEVAVLDFPSGLTHAQHRWSTLVRPGAGIPAFATTVHNLTDGDVSLSPTWAQVSGQFVQRTSGRWICGHHVATERSVLTHHLTPHLTRHLGLALKDRAHRRGDREEEQQGQQDQQAQQHEQAQQHQQRGEHWRPLGYLDTLKLARHLLPQAPAHGLHRLLELTGVPLSADWGRAHRATCDAVATALLAQHLITAFGLDWSTFHALCALSDKTADSPRGERLF
ncbi:3'-5' exonuclease [Kineococcus sp. SYSU DK005]|uniref:3'-5' exonuclease n=1 Tax=Kineococcus sp. SYSU DK005 TaxID=3383126 RepID=UPI003D7DDC8D